MISISAWISEPHESGYKYLITKGCTSWTAYKTDKGFKQFIEITGIDIDETKTRTTKGGYIRRYDKKKKVMVDTWKDDLIVVYMTCKPREINEVSFWKFGELAEGSKSFTGLSNGSYTTCYYLKENNKTTIYRPNPNATEENKNRYKTQEEYETAVKSRIHYPNPWEFDVVYKPLTLAEHIAYSKIYG